MTSISSVTHVSPATAEPAWKTPLESVAIVVMDGFHGQLEPFVRPQYDERALGGIAHFSAALQQVAETHDAVMLGSGGDAMTGPEVSNRYNGAPVIDLLNQQQCTFWAANNHDFDFGQVALRQRLDQADFPGLAGNLVEADSNKPVWETSHTLNVFRPYTTHQLGSLKVGIIGLMKPEATQLVMPSHMRGLSVADPAESLKHIVPDLMQREHPGCILLSCQVQDRAEELCRLIHTLAADATGERPFVVLVGGKKGPPVEGPGYIITSAEDRASELNVVQLSVDRRTSRVQAATCEHRWIVAQDVEPDPEVAAMVQGYVDRVAGDMAEVVGYTPVTLRRSNESDSPMGNLVTDAMRHATGADIAFESGGFMKGDLFAGPIRVGDCAAAMPFNNRAQIVRMTGLQVRRVLEDSVAPTLNKRVLQMSGLRMSYAADRPAGERVVSATMADGSPIDDKRTYLVAVDEYLSEGGDGKQSMAGLPTMALDAHVRNMVVDYLHHIQTPATQPDGRIHCLSGS